MGLIPEETIREVLDRCDIAETVGEYLSLKKAGRNFKACCPFHHEKTPSFVVNRDKQIFHCFGCGVGGNVISFVMQHEHVDFPSAVRILAQRIGIVIKQDDEQTRQSADLRDLLFQANEAAVDFFHQILVSGQQGGKIAKEYFKDRGVKLETAQRLKIGFALDEWEALISFLRSKNISLSTMEKAGLVVAKEKAQGFYDRFRNRVIFPIFDVRSRCLGFGARSLGKDTSAKYINSPETAIYTKREHLYGLHLTKQSIAQNDYAVIVEGYMDFLTPLQAGFEPIVASLGTALTVEQIRLLRRYTRNVVMLFDSDVAGESAMIRSLDTLIDEDMHVNVAVLEDNQDPDSFVRSQGIDAFKEKVDNAQTLFDYKLRVLSRQHDRKTIEGRARICTDMLVTIAKVKNHVIQEGYLRKLAQSLSVSEQALWLEMKKISLNPQPEISINLKATTSFTARIVERNLLRLLLEEQQMISLVKEEIVIEDFQDEQVRPILKRIFDLPSIEETVDILKVIHDFQDQETLKFLSELMTASQPLAIDKEVLRRDYVKRIKQDRQKIERKNLCQAIQQAEAEGNDDKLNELKEQFNQLIKRS